MECETKIKELKRLLSSDPFNWDFFLKLDRELHVISSPQYKCSFPWLLSRYPPQPVLHQLLLRYQNYLLSDVNKCKECLITALHYSNVEMIGFLSYYQGTSLLSQPLDDSTLDLPLHQTGNVEVASILIKSFPEAVKVANNQGNLPIHLAIMHFKSPEHIKLLIQEGKRNCIIDGHGGVLMKNRAEQTPLSILCHQVETGVDLAYLKFPLYKPDMRLWQNLNTLLEAYYTDDNGVGYFRILHALISLNCPYQAIYMGIMLAPQQIKEADENGRYPLSLAASQKSCRKEILTELLHAYPYAIHTSDNMGRHPLHWAAVSGRGLDEGIKELIDADPAVLRLPDKDGMFPYLLAASNCESSLSTIYYLLRECPENIML